MGERDRAGGNATTAVAGLIRWSVDGALRHVARLGWRPASVVDVGAAYGQFTRAAVQVFPASRYLLVEPLEHYLPSLEFTLQRVGSAMLAPVAAGAVDGEAGFHVHEDWVGSSLLREAEGPTSDGVERLVPVRRLDALCADHGLDGPFLLKLDVQGAELDVIAGASEVLARTDYLIVEALLFPFLIGGPQLHDIVATLHGLGFVAYDLLEWGYRPLDGALAQIDLAFVREDGAFRREHAYATPEQRSRQNLMFEALQTEFVGRRLAEGRGAGAPHDGVP